MLYFSIVSWISLFALQSFVQPASAGCGQNVTCRQIAQAIAQARAEDQAASGSIGRVLGHATFRLGFGPSSLERSEWSVDGFQAAQVDELAEMITAQIEGRNRSLAPVELIDALDAGTYEALKSRLIALGGSPAQIPAALRRVKNGRTIGNFINYDNTALNIQLRSMTMLGATTLTLISRALIYESLLHEAFGSVRLASTGIYRDSQVNVDGVISNLWFNHFNVDLGNKRTAMLGGGNNHYHNTIRQTQFSTFREMLTRVTKSPAMLHYLNNDVNYWDSSSAPAAASNQNLGREIMELHSIGRGPRGVGPDGNSPYNQTDVEVMSAILAGHGIDPQTAEYRFKVNRHVPSYLSWMHHFWTSRSDASRPIFFDQDRLQWLQTVQPEQRLNKAIHWLVGTRATKGNVCTKLLRKFMRGSSLALRHQCIAAFGDDGDFKAMYKELVTSKEFWKASNRDMLANPHEVVIQGIRSAGLTRDGLMKNNSIDEEKIMELLKFMNRSMMQMGLPYNHVADPTGHEEQGTTWISTGYFIYYMPFAFNLAHLDHIFDVTIAPRVMTENASIRQDIDGIAAVAPSELLSEVSQRVQGQAYRTNDMSRLSPYQADYIKDFVIEKPQDHMDLIRVGATWQRATHYQGVMNLAFNSIFNLFK